MRSRKHCKICLSSRHLKIRRGFPALPSVAPVELVHGEVLLVSPVVYCHHYSKGAQGAMKAMDRASGSGVFARDPDAQLDVIELEMTDEIVNNVRDGNATAWRRESSLREFPNIIPLEFWFEHPIHRIDTGAFLKEC